ncbi:MAG: sensor signal transduction histidine kinase [Verrucomicrobiales bacterium]|nr:sensor signal transduction histidine kinase [Verrucomicrobiales bacterium]
MTATRFKDFKLHTKVLLAMVGVIIILVAAILFTVNHRLNRQLQVDTKQALITAEAVFKNSQKINARNLFLRFRNIAQEPRYRAACQQQDPRTLKPLLADLLKADPTGDTIGISVVQFTGSDGRIIAAARNTEIDLDQFARSSESSLKQAFDGISAPASIVIEVNRDLFDVISVPVITPVDKDVIGILTFAVQIDDVQAKEFSQITGCDIVFASKEAVAASSLNEAHLIQRCIDLFTRLVAEKRQVPIDLTQDHYLALTGRLNDLNGDRQPGYILLYSYHEPLKELHATQRMIIAVGVAGMILSSLVVWFLIRSITRPLRELRDTAEAVGAGDFSRKVNVTSGDECGELGLVFNRMTDRLETSRQNLDKAHKELVETSRQAGMAEVATGVLHNVGNVLNSVNVSSACVTENIANSKISNLARIAELLSQHGSDMADFMTHDPKGIRLPGYLGALAKHLSEEQVETLKELGHLRKNVEHIKDIITMQQGFARVSGLIEALKASDLVDDALRMNATTLTQHDIQVIRDFNDVPLIQVQKHKVLQILVNLIRNATQACDHSGRPDKQITICVANGHGQVRISVSDNGVGIPQENLARIFSHGFTTKKDGHGFGLHSGAIAAREMGGSLKIHSEGPGKGAKFTLELPLA